MQKWSAQWYTHISLVQGEDIYKQFKHSFLCTEACMWVTKRKNCDWIAPLTDSLIPSSSVDLRSSLPFSSAWKNQRNSSCSFIHVFICSSPTLSRVYQHPSSEPKPEYFKGSTDKTLMQVQHEERWATASVHHSKYTTSYSCFGPLRRSAVQS